MKIIGISYDEIDYIARGLSYEPVVPFFEKDDQNRTQIDWVGHRSSKPKDQGSQPAE